MGDARRERPSTRSLFELGTLFAVATIVIGSVTGAGLRSTPDAHTAATVARLEAPDHVPVAGEIVNATDEPVGDEAAVTPAREPTGSVESVPMHADAPTERADRDDPSTPKRPDGADPPSPGADVAPLERPVVILYGDSLAWEARHVFELALADRSGVEVITRTFGGTAICDWFDEMAADAATLVPGLVVLEFVGNNFTTCMRDRDGDPLVGAALVDRYDADADAAIATFAAIGSQIVLAGAPVSRIGMSELDSHEAPLNAVYERLARLHDGVRYVDAGAAVLDGGEWTATLPCLPQEPCPDESGDSGQPANVVRAPDGLHFCPASEDAVRGVTGDCPVWSSGAFRYGTALARPVLDSLDAAVRAPARTPTTPTAT